MIIGVWAYLDNNIGDDLMVKLLAENFKKHTFFLYSDKTVVKNTFKDIDNIIVRNSNMIENDLNQMKLFLSIGGSIFNNLNTLKGKLVRIRRIKFMKKIKKRKIAIATIGCNLGPYKDKLGQYLTKIELKLNDLVTVRDVVSYNMIKKFKNIKNYHIGDDIVNGLEGEIEFHEKDAGLGITAYRSLEKDECNYSNYVVLAKIVDCYITKTNNCVKLFAFDSENENDLSAAHHIFEMSENKNKVKIIPYLGNINQFLNEFSKCKRHIAIRFHGAILSNLMDIPFLPIIYSNKMLGFLKDNGYEEDTILLKELIEDKVELEHIVNKLISGEGLFIKDNNNLNSQKHFLELEKLINSLH